MVASKPTLDIFTGSQGLGSIFKEQNQITVKFLDFNIPLTDTTGRGALNIMGKTRLLIVQGAQDGEGFGQPTDNQNLAQFIYVMETWINKAGINEEQVYTDSFGVSYVVDAVDWTWIRSFDDPYRILYTLIMKETS